MYAYGPLLGMHLIWWVFWIVAMIGVFGYNVPERARGNSLDPHIILRRRFAKGQISEDGYKKMTAQLRSNEESVQQDVKIQTSHTKAADHPIIDGLSFSATWAILYSVCASLFWLAPEAMLTAMSKLTHGMSFTQMAQAGTSFGFGDFVSVLTLGAIYTFTAGLVWSIVHSYFLRQRAEFSLEQLEKRKVEKTELNPQTR